MYNVHNGYLVAGPCFPQLSHSQRQTIYVQMGLPVDHPKPQCPQQLPWTNSGPASTELPLSHSG